MGDRPYPDGIDCVWLASDRNGHVAAFVTAGVGPVPTEALNWERPKVEDVEELVCGMPHVTAARVLVPVDSFVELAERGLFVYDWSDVHRTTRDELRAYELVAIPVSPITVDVLPANLACIARTVKFAGVIFADGKTPDVRKQMSCSERACSGGRA